MNPAAQLRPLVLVTGYFAYHHLEPSFCNGLRRSGARVAELPVMPLLGPHRRIQNFHDKYQLGPGIVAANLAVVEHCRRLRPDVLLAWGASWLRPWAIAAARRAGVGRVALYNVDDPLGPDRDRPAWRRFRETIPHADACFTVRRVNLEEYRAAGAKRVGLAVQAFDPAFHHPVELDAADRERWGSDVVFIGHCEDDDRLELMDGLIQSGAKVAIHGGGWDQFASGHAWVDRVPVRPVYGLDYLKAIAAAKIGLVFLSRRNRDEYTNRCFEIPAIGTLMLAPRTPGLLDRYREGVEAAFFSGTDELIGQVHHLLANEELRLRIAAAGRARALSSGYDVDANARRIIQETLTT